MKKSTIPTPPPSLNHILKIKKSNISCYEIDYYFKSFNVPQRVNLEEEKFINNPYMKKRKSEKRLLKNGSSFLEEYESDIKNGGIYDEALLENFIIENSTTLKKENMRLTQIVSDLSDNNWELKNQVLNYIIKYNYVHEKYDRLKAEYHTNRSEIESLKEQAKINEPKSNGEDIDSKELKKNLGKDKKPMHKGMSVSTIKKKRLKLLPILL